MAGRQGRQHPDTRQSVQPRGRPTAAQPRTRERRVGLRRASLKTPWVSCLRAAPRRRSFQVVTGIGALRVLPKSVTVPESRRLLTQSQLDRIRSLGSREYSLTDIRTGYLDTHSILRSASPSTCLSQPPRSRLSQECPPVLIRSTNDNRCVGHM